VPSDEQRQLLRANKGVALRQARGRPKGVGRPSGGFKHSDWFTGHKAVQHVRAKVYFIGPHNRPGFGINLNLTEET